MASVPPRPPDRIEPRSPPERREAPEPSAPPAIPETEPCAPDIDEPDPGPDECPEQ